MRRILIAFVVATLFVAMATPAGATPPSGVNIEVVAPIFGGDPGSFVASGPAVDDGLICDAGTVVDFSVNASGFSQNGFNVHAIKHFTCYDGSGDFFVKLEARIDFRKGTTFNWNVIGGTLAYEDLHSVGSGVSFYDCGEDCVRDVYEGGLHID